MPKALQPITTKPLPSSRLPALVVLLLLAGIVFVALIFLRAPGQLLGPPIPKNEYEAMMKAPAPKPKPAPVLAPPGVPTTAAGSATVVAPITTPSPPPPISQAPSTPPVLAHTTEGAHAGH